MYEAIKPLSELLTRMPADESHPGRTAGPSFVVRTMHALPYKDSAWRLIRERLQELGEHAGDLAGKAAIAEPMAALQQGLKGIAAILDLTPSPSV